MNSLQVNYQKEVVDALKPLKRVKTDFRFEDGISKIIVENIPFENLTYNEKGVFKVFSTTFDINFPQGNADDPVTKGDMLESLVLMSHEYPDERFQGLKKEYEQLTGTIEELSIIQDNHFLLKTTTDNNRNINLAFHEMFDVSDVMESKVEGFEGARIEAKTDELFEDTDLLIIGDITGDLGCNKEMHTILGGIIPQIEVEYIEMNKPPQFAVLSDKISDRVKTKLSKVLKYIT